MQHMTAPQLAASLADGTRAKPILLDVREPWEYETCHIEGALLMPMKAVPARIAELDPQAAIVCICHHGARSLNVADFLEQNGYTSVTNLTGGIHAWSLQVDPAMPQY